MAPADREGLRADAPPCLWQGGASARGLAETYPAGTTAVAWSGRSREDGPT
jgi:hypothetical protein